MKEVILSKGSFGKARELTGKFAVIKQLLNLVIMQKNSHPTDKDMGVDIESYFHEFADDGTLATISNVIQTQSIKYLGIYLTDINGTYVGLGIGKTLELKLTFVYDGEIVAVKFNFENYNINKTVNIYTN